MIKKGKFMRNKLRIFILSLLVFFLLTNVVYAEKWSFVALADNRGSFDHYREVLKLIKKIDDNPKHNSIPVDFILACGDLDPVEKNDAIYKEIFPDQSIIYFPVIGNHEIDDITNKEYIVKTILPRLRSKIKRTDKINANYYFDWKNVRIIALDQYSTFGKGNDRGWVTSIGAAWLEKTIKSTPKKIDHIFIAMHEPAFPRGRHLREGGLTNEEIACWEMFVENNDRVRAVLVGHTHTYSRMRVKNPYKAASSTTNYPDEKGGIYQIDTGNAGNTWGGDPSLTIVWIEINGKKIDFKTIQASVDDYKFKKTDTWKYEK
jgi:hypothetical protein